MADFPKEVTSQLLAFSVVLLLRCVDAKLLALCKVSCEDGHDQGRVVDSSVLMSSMWSCYWIPRSLASL